MTDYPTDPRLQHKCCGAWTKEDCTWGPCPANLDCYTSDELRAAIAEDAWRVDDAVRIFTEPVT